MVALASCLCHTHPWSRLASPTPALVISYPLPSVSAAQRFQLPDWPAPASKHSLTCSPFIPASAGPLVPDTFSPSIQVTTEWGRQPSISLEANIRRSKASKSYA